VHGEIDQAQGFAQRLRDRGMGQVAVPELDSVVTV
jgi:hypothetical protein